MDKNYSASEQTKRELAGALKQMMEHKPLEKIKIQEITDLCGLKRQSFYYHFQDIYDLLHWMFQEEAVSLVQRQEGVLLWQEGILQLFQYLERNRKVCLCALNSLGREHIKRFFESGIHEAIHRTIEKLAREIGLGPGLAEERYMDLLTKVYVIMLAGVMERWLLGEIDCTPEELVAFADRMLQDQIRGTTLRVREERAGQDRSLQRDTSTEKNVFSFSEIGT